MIAANIPDVDALVNLVGADSAFSVSFRRGITHGIPALIAWTVLLSLAFAWAAKKWPREVVEPSGRGFVWTDYLPLAAIAVVSHPSLDWLNNYGVRFLAPFSDRWFYGDTLFIIDPALLILFGVGWALSRFFLARRSSWSPLPARIALGAALLYIVWMKSMSEITRSAAAKTFSLTDPSPRQLMVTPPVPFFQYFARSVAVNDGIGVQYSRWRVVGLSAVREEGRGSGARTGADSALVASVRATKRGARFLLWSRFPYFLPDSGTSTVFVGDMRYSSGNTESWAGIRVDTGATGNRTAR